VFPEALVQTCIVHLIRYSMQFASWKERKTIAAAFKPISRRMISVTGTPASACFRTAVIQLH